MAATAREADVPIVTGDTKVVERGAADGLFITTTGVGEIVVEHELGAAAVRAGDAVLLCGQLSATTPWRCWRRAASSSSAADVASDWRRSGAWSRRSPLEAAGEAACASCATPRAAASRRCWPSWPRAPGLGIEVEEDAIPVSPAVRSVCDLLGYDPLVLANEGKMVLVVAPERGGRKRSPLCRRTRWVVRRSASAPSPPTTPAAWPCARSFGTRRVLDMPVGELLPRIC